MQRKTIARHETASGCGVLLKPENPAAHPPVFARVFQVTSCKNVYDRMEPLDRTRKESRNPDKASLQAKRETVTYG